MNTGLYQVSGEAGPDTAASPPGDRPPTSPTPRRRRHPSPRGPRVPRRLAPGPPDIERCRYSGGVEPCAARDLRGPRPLPLGGPPASSSARQPNASASARSCSRRSAAVAATTLRAGSRAPHGPPSAATSTARRASASPASAARAHPRRCAPPGPRSAASRSAAPRRDPLVGQPKRLVDLSRNMSRCSERPRRGADHVPTLIQRIADLFQRS